MGKEQVITHMYKSVRLSLLEIKYGGYSTCGEVYENGKLSADYKDLNCDGISDVALSGNNKVICEEVKNYEPFRSKK